MVTDGAIKIPGGAVAAAKLARRCLLDAIFRLDDAGLSCPALDNLHEELGGLLAIWAGRRPPRNDTDPMWVAAAASEWRRERDRRRRR